MDPDPTMTLDSTMTTTISESFIDTDLKFGHNLDFSLKLVLSKFGFDIFYNLETMRLSALLKFRQLSAFFLLLLFFVWEISNSDGFIGNILFRSISINPFSIVKYILRFN